MMPDHSLAFKQERAVEMGTMYGWHCEDCGAGKMFRCGGGFLSFNQPEVEELSSKGEFGPAMKMLFGDGIPNGWSTFRENVFYRCRRCGSVMDGAAYRITDTGKRGWLVFYVEPDACPSCGQELMFWDEKKPMSEREISALCGEYEKNGCPECGRKNVSPDGGFWD